MVEWVDSLEFRDGKVVVEMDGTKVTAGYNIERVFLTIPKSEITHRSIILREGEIAIYGFVEQFQYIDYKGGLWLQVKLR